MSEISYTEITGRLIDLCRRARDEGMTADEIRFKVLSPALVTIVSEISPLPFLEWAREDREYSHYYYDMLESDVCAKPVEAAAMLLEIIALDSLDDDAHYRSRH